MILPVFKIAIPLVCAHVIGDFILQTEDDVERKGKFLVLLKHVFWIASISYILVGIINAWHIAVVIMVSHAVIDFIKHKFQKTNFKDLCLRPACPY